jgi:hypothetical protein
MPEVLLLYFNKIVKICICKMIFLKRIIFYKGGDTINNREFLGTNGA